MNNYTDYKPCCADTAKVSWVCVFISYINDPSNFCLWIKSVIFDENIKIMFLHPPDGGKLKFSFIRLTWWVWTQRLFMLIHKSSFVTQGSWAFWIISVQTFQWWLSMQLALVILHFTAASSYILDSQKNVISKQNHRPHSQLNLPQKTWLKTFQAKFSHHISKQIKKKWIWPEKPHVRKKNKEEECECEILHIVPHPYIM